MQIVKKMRKDTDIHMKQIGAMHCVNFFKDAAKVKTLETINGNLRWPSSHFVGIAGPAMGSSDYKVRVVATAERFFTVFTTNSATVEARLYLKGSESIVGVPYESEPGENFRAKRVALGQMPVDDVQTLVNEQGGFSVLMNVQDTGSLFVIPSGFITITAIHGAEYLRWGIESDEVDRCRVQVICANILESFQEYRNSNQPVQEFNEFLGSV